MPDGYFVSLIRTVVPIAVGAALTWLATTFGIVLGEDSSKPLTIAVVGIVIACYYGLSRWIEGRWPSLGRVLLALGLTSKAPTYAKPGDGPVPGYGGQ